MKYESCRHAGETMRSVNCALLSAALLALLTACSNPAVGPAETASPAAESPDAAPVAGSEQFALQCERAGGTVKPVCRMQSLACVKPYADAGKPCASDDECAGKCLATQLGEGVERGMPVAGTCQETDYPCGCFAEVKDGKLDATICID